MFLSPLYNHAVVDMCEREMFLRCCVMFVALNYCLLILKVKKIVGGSAPEEFKGEVKKLADEHHNALNVDSVKAYHYGSRYNVEMEVILPADMTVADSHDIALELQHKVKCPVKFPSFPQISFNKTFSQMHVGDLHCFGAWHVPCLCCC